jgi:adenylate cyclase
MPAAEHAYKSGGRQDAGKQRFYGGALLFLAVTLAASISGLDETGDRAIYDALINRRVKSGAVQTNPLVVPIDLNDQTEAALREQIDTREAFADLLTVLADYNAQPVMDFLFQYPKSRDDPFVAAVHDSRDIVLAVQALEENNPLFSYPELAEEEKELLRKNLWHIRIHGKDLLPSAKTFRMPFVELAGSENVRLGHVNVEPDPDGLFRRSSLFYRWEDGCIPSLALAAAVFQLGIDPAGIELFPGKEIVVPLGDESIRIPVDERGRMLVPFYKTWMDSTDRISMIRIIETLEDDEAYEKYFQALNNHVAVVAEITTTQKDLGVTSFEGLYPLSGLHITMLSSLLSAASGSGGAFFRFAGLWQQCLTILLLLAAVFLAIHVPAEDLALNVRFFAIIAVFTALTAFGWHSFNIVPWYSAGFFGLVLSWLATFGRRLLYRRQEELLLKNALSRYFPHALADRIMAEGRTDLRPAHKELTILFSDICSFTKWSSDKPPEVVHAFLSDYLESMSEIVFSCNGTVDKFMGDGMLAFFGDPFELPDHARQCVQAALAMQQKVRELAEKWKPLADIDLRIRIGINTGRVVAGNLGTNKRIEYTVIGAAVNLAQRMESNAPPGGILVTAYTREKTADPSLFGEKRLVTVKGYAESIEAYEVK